MASSSFGDRVNSLGWSRREQTANTSKPSGIYGTLQKLNPFGEQGYVRLPVTENEEAPGAPLPARTRREEEEGWFARKSCSPSNIAPTPIRTCFGVRLRIQLAGQSKKASSIRCYAMRGMSSHNLARSCATSSRQAMQVMLPCVSVPHIGLPSLPDRTSRLHLSILLYARAPATELSATALLSAAEIREMC